MAGPHPKISARHIAPWAMSAIVILVIAGLVAIKLLFGLGTSFPDRATEPVTATTIAAITRPFTLGNGRGRAS